MADTTVPDPSITNDSVEALDRLSATLIGVTDKTQKATIQNELYNRGVVLFNANTDASAIKLNELSKVTDFANGIIGKLSGKFNEFNNSLKNSQTMTDISATKFSSMATSILGARDSFNSLSNIDSSGLNLFSDQLSGLFTIMRESPGSEIASQAQSKIINILKGSGVEHSKINSLVNLGTDALQKFAVATLKSADNGLKLQNAMLQQSASSGNFNKIIAEAGPNLSRMNDVLARQDSLIQSASNSTGIARESMNQFWNQLSPTVSGMNDLNITVDGSSEKMNILTTAVRMATGSGRAQKDVIDDVNKATQEYGASIQGALTMTARISEISSKFKVPLNDVRGALFAAADKFSMFTMAGIDASKKTEGFVNIMNNYSKALQDTGLSGHQAISVISGMTTSMHGLNMAQKAFLSQQTGGPGGLRGAFQIEGMLKRGETEKVFELIRKQMQKQMGNIVSQSEAEGSEAAAQKRQKQMLILQQGPLAKFAKDDQEAGNILDAFKSVQDGKGKASDLSKTVISDQVKRGQLIQGTSKTPMSELRSTLEQITFKANIGNLSGVQRMMTETAGVDLSKDTADQTNSRRLLSTQSVFNNEETQGSSVIDTQKRLLENVKNLKVHGKALVHGFKQTLDIAPHPIDNKNQKADLAKQIEADKARKANLPKGIDNLVNYKPSSMPNINDISATEDRANPSNMVAKAAAGKVYKQEQDTTANNQRDNIKPNSSNEEVNVQVNVSAICSVCKHEVETSSRVNAISPPTKGN